MTTLHPAFEAALEEATKNNGLEANHAAILTLVEKFLADDVPPAQFNSQLKNLLDSMKIR